MSASRHRLYCVGQYARLTSGLLSFKCLVFRPVTRLRHSLKLEGFRDRRMNSITSDSLKPNCTSIASNGVRSSQAISITREVSSSDSFIEQPPIHRQSAIVSTASSHRVKTSRRPWLMPPSPAPSFGIAMRPRPQSLRPPKQIQTRSEQASAQIALETLGIDKPWGCSRYCTATSGCPRFLI